MFLFPGIGQMAAAFGGQIGRAGMAAKQAAPRLKAEALGAGTFCR